MTKRQGHRDVPLPIFQDHLQLLPREKRQGNGTAPWNKAGETGTTSDTGVKAMVVGLYLSYNHTYRGSKPPSIVIYHGYISVIHPRRVMTCDV